MSDLLNRMRPVCLVLPALVLLGGLVGCSDDGGDSSAQGLPANTGGSAGAGVAGAGGSASAASGGVGGAAACPASIGEAFDALQSATDAMERVAGEMKVSVGSACKAIAEAGGETVSTGEFLVTTPDSEVKAACDLAVAVLEATPLGSGASMMVSGGSCTVDGESQLSCEKSCQDDDACEGGSVEDRCSPGDFSAGGCQSTLEPPQCLVETECATACEALGNFGATCVPPTVTIESPTNAALAAVLEAQLPILFQELNRSRLTAETAVDVVSLFHSVASAVAGTVSCVAELGSEIALIGERSEAAHASILATTEATARTSGAAGNI